MQPAAHIPCSTHTITTADTARWMEAKGMKFVVPDLQGAEPSIKVAPEIIALMLEQWS